MTAKKTAAPSKLSLLLNWVPEPGFGGLYAAREPGTFARHGLEVEISGGGDAVLKRLICQLGQFRRRPDSGRTRRNRIKASISCQEDGVAAHWPMPLRGSF